MYMKTFGYLNISEAAQCGCSYIVKYLFGLKFDF